MFKRTLVSVGAGSLSGILAVVLVRALSFPTSSVSQATFIDSLVTFFILTIGALLSLWYFMTACALVCGSVLESFGSVPKRLNLRINQVGAPLLRRATTWGVVSSIALATPAIAMPDPLPSDTPGIETVSTSSSKAPVDLGWAPSTPDIDSRSTTSAIIENGAPLNDETRAGNTPPAAFSNESSANPSESYEVQPGDSLWDITKSHLDPSSNVVADSEVARQWPSLHELNMSQIGSDPNRITPGMILDIPDWNNHDND